MAHSEPEPVGDDELEALLAACQVLVAVSARSLAATESVLDIAAFRVLVMAAGEGCVAVGQLADQLRLHPATAERLCARLVLMNLLRPPRRDSAGQQPSTGRFSLTPQGQGLVHMVMSRRRAAVEPALARLPAADRAALVTALHAFAAAAGEPERHELWAMGWTH
ncbi:MarR family winged helix-turn-helix transcriptional regulator [Jatrophihabitans sp.]|uniref:MarR family winged helix-turn-helix transcriptional regulator n=1 Tax=Jatrophihabitans sp. TaxID=1932789 RepID=UPI002CBA4F99|nr:hypothetical protein [Jatrophihabitans sp.]